MVRSGVPRFDAARWDFYIKPMKTLQAQPQKLREEAQMQAEEQTNNAAKLVQWAYRLNFVRRTQEPRITGLGYYQNQLASVEISMHRGDTTVHIASEPVSLAQAMELFVDLQTAERVAWADNQYGSGYEKFLRAVTDSLAAAQTDPQVIAA